MRKILIVEDEEILRESYKTILSTEPYIVETAEDGEKALELCKHTQYDLILLDLMMPKLDGAGFLDEYDKLGLPASKVIILSNLSSGEGLNKALQIGIHKSVIKANLSPRQLLSMVRYELQAI